MGRDKKALDGLTFVLDGPRASSWWRASTAELARSELTTAR
jgi:hypothetical protein